MNIYQTKKWNKCKENITNNVHLPHQIPSKRGFNKTLRKIKPFNKLLICNHRPKNMRDFIMPSDIQNIPGDIPNNLITIQKVLHNKKTTCLKKKRTNKEKEQNW